MGKLQQFENALNNLRDYEVQVNQLSGQLGTDTPMTDALLRSGLLRYEVRGLLWGAIESGTIGRLTSGGLNLAGLTAAAADVASASSYLGAYNTGSLTPLTSCRANPNANAHPLTTCRASVAVCFASLVHFVMYCT